MRKPIEPMDDFWKQILQDLNNTTDEEWSQFIEEYEKEIKPMQDTLELCNKILNLIESLDNPYFLRFDELSIIIEYDTMDTYGDVLSKVFISIYEEEELVCGIDSPAYGDTRFILYVKIIEKQPFLRHIIELLEARVQLQGGANE